MFAELLSFLGKGMDQDNPISGIEEVENTILA